MPADPRDNFSAFDGQEHMFFGLEDPYAYIREEVASSLAAQVPGTQIESIVCYDEPKWLTLGRRMIEDEERVSVGHFAACFRCRLDVVPPNGSGESLDATMTFMFRNIDRPDAQARIVMDLHRDADAGFAEDRFKQRFLGFREEVD